MRIDEKKMRKNIDQREQAWIANKLVTAFERVSLPAHASGSWHFVESRLVWFLEKKFTSTRKLATKKKNKNKNKKKKKPNPEVSR